MADRHQKSGELQTIFRELTVSSTTVAADHGLGSTLDIELSGIGAWAESAPAYNNRLHQRHDGIPLSRSPR